MRKKKQSGFQFDFSSLTFSNAGKPTEDIEEIPKLSMEPAMFENAEKMAADLDYSKDYFAFVPGNFIFGDFIEALVYKKQLKPTCMYITTLGMSENNIDSIVNLVDYLGCKKVNLIVSHYFAGVERHKLMPYMRKEFAGTPIDVAILQSHCKIVLIFSQKGNIMISGSANLSSSNNVEQFLITHDESAIKFARQKLDNVMERFTVYRGNDAQIEMLNGKNTGRSAFDVLTGGD